jgi:hypothetical protein
VEAPQHDADAPPHDEARTLKGFTFRPPLLLDTAFVGTNAGLAVVIGREVTSDVRLLTASGTGLGQELVYDINQSFVAGRVQAGASILGRVEIGVDMTFTSYVVGDQNTAILYGGQSSVAIDPGVRVSILRSTRTGTALSVRGYGVIRSGTRLNPSRVLAAIADNIDDISNDPARTSCLAVGDVGCALGEDFNAFDAMKVSRSRYGGGVGVSLAQAIASRFGVQATTGFELARGRSSSVATGDLGSTPFTFYAGVAPAVDFAPKVPIGVMAEYRFAFTGESFSGDAVASTSTRTIEHGFAAGVYYTGRRDLTVGLAFQGAVVTSSVDAGSLPTTTRLGGLATMRHYF